MQVPIGTRSPLVRTVLPHTTTEQLRTSALSSTSANPAKRFETQAPSTAKQRPAGAARSPTPVHTCARRHSASRLATQRPATSVHSPLLWQPEVNAQARSRVTCAIGRHSLCRRKQPPNSPHQVSSAQPAATLRKMNNAVMGSCQVWSRLDRDIHRITKQLR
jgi:hypothetical protein